MASQGLARIGVFVSVCVACLAIAAILFSGASPRVEPHSSTFIGARVLPPGPAPVGLPMIPVRVQSDGTLVGLPTHLDWDGYCSPPGTPGLDRDYPGPNTFRVFSNPEKIAHAHTYGAALWWEHLLNQTLRADAFDRQGIAAPAVWRSDDASLGTQLRVLVFKVDPAWYPESVRREFAPDGYAAFMAPSTGYCCVAGFQENTSPFAHIHDQDVIYDSCHDSRWDPRQVRTYQVPDDWSHGLARVNPIV